MWSQIGFDLMGLELVKEFDNLTKKFYSVFDDDLIVLSEGSDMYLGLRTEVFREEVYIIQHNFSSDIRPNNDSRVRKIAGLVGPIPISVEKRLDYDRKSSLISVYSNGNPV